MFPSETVPSSFKKNTINIQTGMQFVLNVCRQITHTHQDLVFLLWLLEIWAGLAMPSLSFITFHHAQVMPLLERGWERNGNGCRSRLWTEHS